MGCSGEGAGEGQQGMLWGEGHVIELYAGLWSQTQTKCAHIKAGINLYNYIADAAMSQGIQKSLQTLRAQVTGISLTPELVPGWPSAKVNKQK